MSIYTVYFGVGVVTFVVGLLGFYAANRALGESGEDDDPDATAAMIRSIPLFVAIVGFGGILFGGVGVLVGLIA